MSKADVVRAATLENLAERYELLRLAAKTPSLWEELEAEDVVGVLRLELPKARLGRLPPNLNKMLLLCRGVHYRFGRLRLIVMNLETGRLATDLH